MECSVYSYSPLWKCPICFENTEDALVLDCGHSVGENCYILNKLENNNEKCPLCRKVSKSETVKNYSLITLQELFKIQIKQNQRKIQLLKAKVKEQELKINYLKKIHKINGLGSSKPEPFCFNVKTCVTCNEALKTFEKIKNCIWRKMRKEDRVSFQIIKLRNNTKNNLKYTNVMIVLLNTFNKFRMMITMNSYKFGNFTLRRDNTYKNSIYVTTTNPTAIPFEMFEMFIYQQCKEENHPGYRYIKILPPL